MSKLAQLFIAYAGAVPAELIPTIPITITYNSTAPASLRMTARTTKRRTNRKHKRARVIRECECTIIGADREQVCETCRERHTKTEIKF